ncbi:hypothetical protein QZH41_000168 [Actinostola sp. cb2023]|nr:hypothetical protein QZH41_000168 [Actinostola sp. cb2023]
MQVVWAVLLAIESFLIISCNIVAIRIFLNKKFVVMKSSYMLVNLTVADVLQVGISALFTLLEVVFSSEFMFIACKGAPINRIAQSISLFTLFASLISLALMALERFSAIIFPFRFRRVQRKHYLFAIAISWCVSIPLVFLRLINTCSDMKARIITNMFVIIVMVLFIAIIVISYAAIFVKNRFFPEIQATISMQKNIKLAKTLMLTTSVAILTWLPRFAALVLKKLKVGKGVSEIDISIAFLIIIYSNSFANLLVYTLRMPAFREELKKMFPFKCFFKVNNAVNPAPSDLVTTRATTSTGTATTET